MAENINNQNLEDDEPMFVTLDLDDGSQLECEVLTIFEVNEQDYIALLPNPDDAENEEVYIYRYDEDEEGNPSLTNIEDDDEYEAVADRFDELLDEAAFDEM